MRGASVRGGGGAGLLALVVVAAAALAVARGDTVAADVSAINGLYVALGSPTLPGWTGSAGDPCGELWQGVICSGSSIISVTMNAANLGGHLGSLGNFTSIITINLSNNKIGGTIPEDLPVTLQHLFLSANQLTGSIPSSLAKLKNLTDMSLNENQLSGELPDAFDSLPGLVNLDISSNNITGILPTSMKSLSSLTTLRMQGNQLSGTLNVLQDLPLKDLNVENNLFSGPVPAKLLNIPNFKKDGNPFNTSIAPSASSPSTPIGPAPTPTPSPIPTGPKLAPTPTPTVPNPIPSSSPPSASRAPPSSTTPSNSSDGSTNRGSPSSSKKKNSSTLKIIGFVFLGVVLFIVIALLVIFCLSKYQERQSRSERSDYNRSQRARVHHKVEPKINPSSVQPRDNAKKGEILDRRVREPSLTAEALPKKPSENQKEHIINLERTDLDLFAVAPPSPPLPLSPLPVQKVVVNPVIPPEKRYSSPPRTSNKTSATPFSVASLQQYTSSFREENLIRESRLGKVYLAELPDGKLLEVLKIDNPNGRISVDVFLELVDHISDLKHPNILELVGYCAEYGQRLLVYNHFSRKTLDDALHDGEDIDNALSWNARLQVALGSGKALEYLHESFHPPIVHQNFEPANVLLDNKLSVCVAECGLAERIPSSSVTQLSGRIRALLYYEAPEFQESGTITERGDVYSFGVVMLELLTGRKPYDSSRPRAEQHLVRWANSQLHDIESLSKMVDPSIRGLCPEKALSRFADIISRCIQREPEFRPPISEIVQDLARIVHATGEESE